MAVSFTKKSRPDHRVTSQINFQLVPRKVRTPKSKVVGNAHPEQSAGQCHRKLPPMKIGKGEKVRVRDHRICSDVDGKVNPTWSKTR